MIGPLRPVLREASGERRLYLAVLEDALARLAGANPESVSSSALAAQVDGARTWFIARDDEAPFSFESVCAALGLAASPLRRAALAGKLKTYAFAHIARRVEARPRLSGRQT